MSGIIQALLASFSSVEEQYLYSWGNNYAGKLGIGLPGTIYYRRSSPVQVGNLTNWAQVSAGGGHTLAVKTDGTMWSWGSNATGRLGVDTTGQPRSSPIQIGALTVWAQVSAGSSHSMAIKTAGSLWAWGNAQAGRLGLNSVSPSRNSPVQVGSLTNWAQVAASNDSTVAIKTDGTMWSWGSNQNGRLGHNNLIYRSSPVQIGALTNWAQVSAAGAYCWAVKTDGTIWSWGAGAAGRLGHNNVIDRSSPVQIGSLTNWAQVSYAKAVKTDGTLWAWGSGGSGQIGDNTTINRSSPVQIGALTSWLNVQGESNTVAIKTDGTIWGWGNNSAGQIGDGTRTNRSSPVQVGALTGWTQISTGGETTHAILQE